MTEFALSRISQNPNGFLAVLEEEGTDNMCNYLNASGCLEAFKRADDAVGVILDFITANPNTFMVTASDSNAGGMQVLEVESACGHYPLRTKKAVRPLMESMAQGRSRLCPHPIANGNSFPLAIGWASGDDVGSGVIARGAGLKGEELLPTSGILNTDIYRMLYFILFGEQIPREIPEKR